MTMANHQRIGTVLALLRDGVAGFVVGQLRHSERSKALAHATTLLGSERALVGKPVSQWDVAPLLKLIWSAWNEVFQHSLGRIERSLISELRDCRNRWAHQSPFSPDDTYRAIDSAGRLLSAMSAPQAREVHKMKLEVLRELLGERPGDISAPEMPTAGATDEASPGSPGSLPQRILATIKDRPGLTDRELTDLLLGKGKAQQPVNSACRALTSRSLVQRQKRTDGKIGNYVADVAPVAQSPVAGSRASDSNLSEDQVKTILSSWLGSEGWIPVVKWAKDRGIDIDARRGSERWIIEVKGSGAYMQVRVNYFLGALAELLQRANDETARYSVAFPDLGQYRRLWGRLPALAKQRARITALFVSENGKVEQAT